ncbi:hypothetical protein U1Q18_019229 [Sarracenia purpurea var. burkii]
MPSLIHRLSSSAATAVVRFCRCRSSPSPLQICKPPHLNHRRQLLRFNSSCKFVSKSKECMFFQRSLVYLHLYISNLNAHSSAHSDTNAATFITIVLDRRRRSSRRKIRSKQQSTSGKIYPSAISDRNRRRKDSGEIWEKSQATTLVFWLDRRKFFLGFLLRRDQREEAAELRFRRQRSSRDDVSKRPELQAPNPKEVQRNSCGGTYLVSVVSEIFQRNLRRISMKFSTKFKVDASEKITREDTDFSVAENHELEAITSRMN